MTHFNFTKTDILKLPSPKKGYKTYHDTKEKGLCLYISKVGGVTFFIRKRINGKEEKIILGRFPDLTVEQARNKAIKAKNLIANDKENPNDKKREFSQESTLKELFDTYMEKHSKPNKKSWVYDEREIPRFCSHWFNRKISTITQFEIKEWLENIKEENGIYQANHMLERLRSMYSKKIEWGWKGLNPCTGIGKFPVKSRDRFIQPEEMKRFFAALNNEQSIAREYFFMALYTGARKTNTLAMRWEQIDFDLRTWYIPETKNGESQTVPLIEDAVILLHEIKQKQQDVDGETIEWVFPSEESKFGHLQDPKKAWKRILTEAGLKDLRIHDIRRTLGSYQAIAGTSLHIIGKSLGHKSSAATQVYARMNLEPIRNSMQKAVDLMKGKNNNKEEKSQWDNHMKIDYNFLKEILSNMENESSHSIRTHELMTKIRIDDDNEDRFIGHLKLLKDNSCIDSKSKDLGFMTGLSGEVISCNAEIRITAQGYEFLEMLRDDTLLKKISNLTLGTALEVGKAWIIKSIVGN